MTAIPGSKLLRARPRLLGSVFVAIVLWLALPHVTAFSTRTILALDTGCLLFLILTLVMVLKATPDRMRRAASLQDEGLLTILATTFGGAIFSIAVILLELKGAKDLPRGAQALHVGLAVASMGAVWLVVHTLFALHYAHSFYDIAPAPSDKDKTGETKPLVGGLDIPDCAEPDYWDFLYFAFVIGMTCQTSDVQITSRDLRRMALGHGILSFLFNTVILALAINVAASLL